MVTQASELGLGKGYRYGWHDEGLLSVNVPKRGLSRGVVEEISRIKGEPEWMTRLRLKAYEHFLRRPMPAWGGKLGEIDFDNIYYYVKPIEEQVKSWEDLPADIRNTYVKLGIPEAEREFLGGVTAQYECLRGDALVWTGGGMRPIKSVEPGDEVFSLSGKEIVRARVTGKRSSGEKEVFEIRARGRTIVASANHPFLALRDRRRPGKIRAPQRAEWMPVEDLRCGDFVAVATDLPEFGAPSPLLTPNRPARFPAETSDDLCWWAGVYLGDGYLHHRGDYVEVEIAVDRTDSVLIEEIRRVTRALFGVEFELARDGFRLSGRGTAGLAEFVELNGLGGNAHTKRIPDWAFGLPRSQRLSLLAGYLDADGWVRSATKAKNPVLTSANEDLLEDARGLARLCGIGTSRVIGVTNRHPFERERTLRAYHLHLSGRFDRLPCRSPRRAERLRQRRYGHSYRTAKGTDLRAHTSEMLGFARIEDISPAGVEEVFDIEVAGHHNFVAEGFVVHNSEVVYHRVRDELSDKGILFSDMDTALREHPDIVKRYFGTVIPANDNKFAALNTAVWSGGSFIYVPPGVHVDIPLQAYFRINRENMGQFERTLIVVDEGAYVHYVEGCSAPVYSSDSLHSAVVEILVKKGGRCRYTTIQNWSANVYNLVTKRAVAYEDAVMEWVDGNIGCLAQGSRVTARSGPKPIEDVVPGEEILSYDEASGALVWRAVRAKRFSGRQPVREVRVGARRLFVTDNHPFLSYVYDPEAPKKHGRYALGYVRADRLRKAIVPVASLDYGAPRKVSLPGIATQFVGRNQYVERFDATRGRARRVTAYEETTDDLMWLFGMFLGDGSIERRSAQNGGTRWAKVTFSVPVGDRARARLMRVMADVMEGVEPTKRKDGVSVTWNSVELADLFDENGFVTGALTKRLPEWVLGIPESHRLHLLAGYLDSDGCAPAGRRGFSIKSVNRDLLAGVADLLTSLGIPCRIHTEQDGERDVEILGYTSRSRGSHRLDFPCDRRLLKIVSPGLSRAALAQPRPRLVHFKTVGRSTIALPASVEVRPVEVGELGPPAPTWDIEVDGTGNFVSEGFIVHNSKLTMKYPSIYLLGEGARGEVLSVAFAGAGQHQDAGGKVVCAAPRTSGQIISKSVSAHGGRTTYRGLVRVEPEAREAKVFVRCDALMLDPQSRSDTYPYMEVDEETASVGHEATVSKIGDEQLFYLMSRGISETDAMGMIVNGFIEPITKELPMEYAVELTRLIQLQMEGSVG